MSVVAEIILSLSVVLVVLWWWIQTKRNKELYKHIPGPPTLPILGNALELQSTQRILTILPEWMEKYGGFFKVQVGPFRHLLIVTDYKLLEYVLSTMSLLKKSEEYHFFHRWLGTGLLTSDGSKWKKHRKALTPAFHFQILEQFIITFEICGERLLKKLETELGNSSFDVYPYVTLCALDVICESTMGISVNAQNDESSDYVQSVKHMGRIIMERSISAIEMYESLYPLTTNYRTEKKALKILHSQSNEVIRRRREELKNKKPNEENDSFGPKKKKSFLDLLLECSIDGIPLTDEEIREEVDTFMFEGHDTTASAITFSLYCLANHPDVQAKVLEEQRTLFGNEKNPVITYTDLQNMKYLEQVIKETLRLYPSVPLYGRKIVENIECADTMLPRGSTALIFAYGIHRNPKYFKNPEEFNPDRFNDIDGKLPYAYIPFSAGPRNCIGQKYAMLEMKATISKVVRKFELFPATPTHVLKLSAESILKSANGVNISLKLRTNINVEL